MNLRLLLTAAVLAVTSLHAQVTYLVNDTFTDTDRIGGVDGSSTSSTTPAINTPTSTNTQWVTNGTSNTVASPSGMLWTQNSTSNRMVIGYFPDVTVATNPVTFTLNFTTGTMGAVTNNLRIALVNGTSAGFRTTDGFSSTDASYVGDVGYAIFSSGSTVGGGNTTNLALNTYQRNTTSSNNLLGTAGEWGNESGTSSLGSSSGATGYFQSNTAYSLALTFAYLTPGELTLTTALTGGNFAGLSYSIVDPTPNSSLFNTIALRLGGGSNQFDNVNLTSFTVTTPIPEPSTYALIAGAVLLGAAVIIRRQRKS